MLLPALLFIALVCSLILPASVAEASVTVHLLDDYSISHSAADSSSAASAIAPNMPQGQVTPMVAAGSYHTVGLKADGTVVAVGDNDDGQCEVSGWMDIIQVAAGGGYDGGHTVGLKADGTVVAVGDNDERQCEVGGWTDITQVAAGSSHTVGLKADGIVVAVGCAVEFDDYGQCEVSGWTDVVQVAAGFWHTVGLKSDGTVVAVGLQYCGQCEVGGWTDIVQVSAGSRHTVGLKGDGTVVAVGNNNYEQCEVGGWTDIIQVAAGGGHTVGLKSDGTVVAAGCAVGFDGSEQCEVGGWTDIIQIDAGYAHTVGLKGDGTVVAARWEVELAKWNLVLAVPPSQCILTISSTAGGNVTTPGEGTFTYAPKTVVDLLAEPEEGYLFVNWTGDVDTIADVYNTEITITMNGDYSITANFAKQYDLTISRTEGGSVITPGEGAFTYDEGAVVDLVATPDKGYQFVNWTGDVAAIDDVNTATITITMDGNYSITANFEKIPPPINWPLIGGIITAVVAVGLVIFFVRRKRVA